MPRQCPMSCLRLWKVGGCGVGGRMGVHVSDSLSLVSLPASRDIFRQACLWGWGEPREEKKGGWMSIVW